MAQALDIYRDKIVNPPGVGVGAGVSPTVIIDQVFATRAARDTFYTTDPDAADHLAALVQGETVILIQDDGTGNSVVEIWVGSSAPSSYDNTNWADITSAIPSATTVKTLYESNADTNALVDLKLDVLNVLRVLNNQLVSSLPIVTTPTSIIFGVQGAELASAGEDMVFESTSGEDKFIITNTFDPINGSASLQRSRVIPRDTYTIQPLKTDNSVLNPTFTYTVNAIGPDQVPPLAIEDRRHTDMLTFETADTGTMTVVMRDTDANGRLLRSQEVAVTADTETQVSLDKPVCLDVGTVVHVTITGDVRIKGVISGPDFNPFLRIRSYLGYDDAVVTRSSSNSFAADFRDALQSLVGADRLDASAIKNLTTITARTDEEIRDVVVAMLREGANITLTEDDLANTLTIDTAAGIPRTDEAIRDLVGQTLFPGAGVSIDVDDPNNRITISVTGAGPTPSPGPNDFRYGLSDQSDPALVDFASLTDVVSPTDPQTVETGVATAGQTFHIFSANTHTVQTIRDTVLDEIVYQDGAAGNIVTKTANSRTEAGVTYDAYSVGPYRAGVDESYIVRFS
jgi:hypothetical protein